MRDVRMARAVACATLQPITPALVLDPLLDLLIVLGLALLITSRRHTDASRTKRRYGLWIAWAVWGTLWLFATPRVSFGALSLLEAPAIDLRAALAGTPEDRCVMVVLTGGALSPKPGVSKPELLQGSSMPRALGAARLYSERPVGHVIVTGRADAWDHPDETAAAMGEVLVAFGVPRERVILETLSLDTRQNARFSGAIARELGAEKIVVVTSALHVPRAVFEFEGAGMHVLGAPVDHRYEKPEGWAPYVPSMASMVRMGQVIHEVLGRWKP